MRHRKNNSIFKKMSLVFTIVVVVALTAFGTVVYGLLNNIYEKELIQNYKNIADDIVVQTEVKLASVEELASMICSDSNLQNLVREHIKYEDYEYYRMTREISSALARYVSLKSDIIDDIYFVNNNGNVISRHEFYSDTIFSDWFQEYLGKGVNATFTTVHSIVQKESMNHSKIRNVITYVVSMNNLNGYPKHMGYLLINIKTDALFQEANSFSDFEYEVFDEQGRSLKGNYDLSEERVLLQDKEESIEKISNEYFYKTKINITDWDFISKVHLSLVDASLRQMTVAMLIAIFVVLIGTSIVIRMLSRTITEPLNRLAGSMYQFSNGDYHVKVDIDSGDEIEQIAGIFNEMVDSINLHMETNIKREKEKRKSEVGFLMAQIKPHFIYNCLNCIIYLARQNKVDDIIYFTRTFITVLQMSIKKKPTEEILLLSEIEYLKSYLTLMKYRYGSVPQIICKIPPEFENVTIPALILQPLVENSLFHGNIPDKHVSQIIIYVLQKEDRIQIHVKDDGNGIDAERLEILRNTMEQKEHKNDMEHIGLNNVNARLKLCYGDDHGLHVDSIQGEWTDVWFEKKGEV